MSRGDRPTTLALAWKDIDELTAEVAQLRAEQDTLMAGLKQAMSVLKISGNDDFSLWAPTPTKLIEVLKADYRRPARRKE